MLSLGVNSVIRNYAMATEQETVILLAHYNKQMNIFHVEFLL